MMILPKTRKFAAKKGVGAIIVPTNCISKGVSNAGLMLDHSRALQPRISKTPASITVGNSHHMRNFMACKRWIAVEMPKSDTNRIHIHCVGT